MRLRFRVNQAELFRRGIDAPKSIVVISVNPADLAQPERDLIADRLSGIDVFTKETVAFGRAGSGGVLIFADGLEFSDLMAAIRKDQPSA